MMASIGTSVRGIETEEGGRKIGCTMPKLQSSGINDRQPAWHYRNKKVYSNGLVNCLHRSVCEDVADKSDISVRADACVVASF